MNNFAFFTPAILLLHFYSFSIAQVFLPKKYPQGYFRDPLAIPISLSGNFGELRPNHYHMGVDIKTMARVNLPVYAAADGFIARIKIEPAGFGRAIYINHPNGLTTLYAHLNDFLPQLDTYVKQEQYRQQSWKVFLDLPPKLFPVKKGDFIAYSGTTGGSQAPHLHFELRRTSDDVNLNPLLFGFPLNDQVKPSILRLAIYDRSKSTLEQSPKIIPVKKSGIGFITTPSLVTVCSDKISFAITAYDTHNGSTNLNGVYEALLYDNNRLVTGFQMDNISYNDTRYINAHIDFKTRANGGSYLQHLSELPGYVNSIYLNSSGVIDLSDGKVHAIRILVKDAYSNVSELNYNVRFNCPPGKTTEPAGKIFYPLMIGIAETEDCEFYMGENCLYDSVHVRHIRSLSSNPSVVSAVQTIGSTHIPLQDSMVVRIKPLQNILPEKKGRIVMQRFAGSDIDVQKVQWQNDWASARFREFGSFQLVVDEEPPVIAPVGVTSGDLGKSSRLAFLVRDNLDSFKNFRAELDGKWLRFTNDKGRTFIYRFDEMCPPGEHTLKISVEDEAGNIAVKEFQFKR
ncbi:MAG: M23 family metallopeptidase [Chitinophagaceae bacterium]